MRSIAEQTDDELGGAGSLLVRQRRDHQELERLLNAVAVATDSAQDAALLDLYRLVFPHAFAEESVIWPAVRHAVPNGDELTLRNEQEHQTINELVTRFERMDHGNVERAPLFAQIATLLRQDVRDEEDLILPRLQAVLDDDALQELGRSFETVRRTAPTRPHPTVSRRPPGNVVSALPLSAIDRTRDALERAGHRAPRPLRALARGTSRMLARVAGAVERLPPARSGERRSTNVDHRG